MRFFDFHTHRVPESPEVIALVSAPERPPGVRYWSLERHPWTLGSAWHEPEPGFAAAARDAAAIGEIGLDRLRGPALEIQLAALRRMLAVADELDKTVVFHCVRATPELLAELKRFPRLRKVFHGFGGGTAALEELLRHGFVVSLGERALRNRTLRLPKGVAGRIGVESDDGESSVDELYCRIAERWGGEVLDGIDRTFDTLFGREEPIS